MEFINKEKIGVYLYVACYNSAEKKQEAFMMVTKAMLHEEVTIELENLGGYAILFTSDKSLAEIREKLNTNKTPFILVDLSLSYDLESMCGFLPDSQIEMIKNITRGVFSKNKPRLAQKLHEAVEDEKFEMAAQLRDFKKNNE